MSLSVDMEARVRELGADAACMERYARRLRQFAAFSPENVERLRRDATEIRLALGRAQGVIARIEKLKGARMNEECGMMNDGRREGG